MQVFTWHFIHDSIMYYYLINYLLVVGEVVP
jgi:hypothetical protein